MSYIKMMKAESFGKNLFTSLAIKLFQEVNCSIPIKNLDCMKVKCDFSEKLIDFSDSNDNISLSVLMLSYACRPAYMKHFEEASPILLYDKENPMVYVRTFEEVVLEKYSPLKLLMLCSFISEIFLFVSKRHILQMSDQYYLQQTTQALNEVFRRILDKGFSENGWTDLQNEASKIAAGFKILEPFINKASACQVAYTILTGNHESENQTQQTDIMPEKNLHQMENVNTCHRDLYVPDYQHSENIPLNKAPMDRYEFENKSQQADNRWTEKFSNQMTDLNTFNCELPLPQDDLVKIPVAEKTMDQLMENPIVVNNPVQNPKFFISFGTVDQDPQLLNLLRISEEQIGTVIFETQCSRIGPNFSVDIESTEPFMLNPNAQDISTIRNPENEHEPVFQTTKIPKSGEIVQSVSNTEVISEQDLDNCASQFGSKLALTSRSESEFSNNNARLSQEYQEHHKDSMSVFPSNKNINNSLSEIYSKEENDYHLKSQKFLKVKNSEVEQEPVFRIFKITENGGRELCPPNNEIYSMQEFDNCYIQKLKNLTGSELQSRSVLWNPQSYAESDKDSTSETFYECDSDIETETFFDFESEAHFIDKNTTDAQKGSLFCKRNPEKEQEPVFRTVRITDDGDRETCISSNEAFSVQELDNCVAQFWNKLTLSSGSESEFDENIMRQSQSLPENDSKLEMFLGQNMNNSENEILKDNVNDSDLEIRIEKNVHSLESGTFFLPRNLQAEEPVLQNVKTENEKIKVNVINNEVNDQKETYYVPLPSRIACEKFNTTRRLRRKGAILKRE